MVVFLVSVMLLIHHVLVKQKHDDIGREAVLLNEEEFILVVHLVCYLYHRNVLVYIIKLITQF